MKSLLDGGKEESSAQPLFPFFLRGNAQMSQKHRITTTLIQFMIVLIATGLLRAALPQQGEQPAQPHSVWDGVYTAEQAKRGEPLYDRGCSTCHGEKLAGHEDAPPLAGQDFLESWNGLTVGKLFDKIRLTMPKGEPGEVGVQKKADILAFILSVNKFPAGKTELQKSEALKDIRFEAVKPISEIPSVARDPYRLKDLKAHIDPSLRFGISEKRLLRQLGQSCQAAERSSAQLPTAESSADSTAPVCRRSRAPN